MTIHISEETDEVTNDAIETRRRRFNLALDHQFERMRNRITRVPSTDSLSHRAMAIAGVFNVLSWTVSFLGGALAFFVFLVSMLTNRDLILSTAAAILIIIFTLIAWACISMTTLVAVYIASKEETYE